MHELLTTASLALGLIVIVRWIITLFSPRLPLPPGPKAKPIIGNVLDMPTVRPWKVYRDWCSFYDSDIVHAKLPTQSLMVVGSVQAALDLFDKRSPIYSDRMSIRVLELVSWGVDFNFALMPYGASWRAHRRAFHQYFNQTAVQKYKEVQLQQARASLSWFLDSPKDSRLNVRRMVASVLLRIVYGRKISGMDDEFVKQAQKSVEAVSIGAVPGAFWVQFLPWLRYVPRWVPCNSTAKFVEEYKPIVDYVRIEPYETVKTAVVEGRAVPSIARSLIQKIQEQYEGTDDAAAQHHQIAMNVTGVAYSGGVDTTTSSGESFLLAMALFPGVQRKAQAELDRVVGPHRLPDFSDLGSLTYIRALVMEVVRWMPPLPLGIPHQVSVDDVYKGYAIPKRTVLFANIWAMLHNPDDYPEPETFRPERFLGKDGKIDPAVRDPSTIAFGFGRRICPGRHLSRGTLSIFVASILHVFDIRPGVNESGKPLVLSKELLSGLSTGPCEVPCDIKPRSEAAERLIRDAGLDFEGR